MKAMPSMRLIATAGDAARRQNLSIYNCSYMAVDSIDSFVEALIISMAGCGVGFSVEKDYVEKLPRIMRQYGIKPIHHTIEDTSEGWADALRIALHTWFGGNDIVFNYSEIRPAGAILKTKGGQASGPEPLKTMLNFVRDRILKKQGGVLSTLDAHDIMCTIGNAAVSGGYRRTAMISLFDFDDEIMRHCKDGDFERMNSQRWNANNSSVWPERDLNQQEIAEHFLAMVKGQRGEPGIFSRKSAILTLPDRRKPDRFGTNPCVIGDTWVAVADGRGRAKMIDLVNDGKDVPVFTVVDGKLVSRMMRNPRKTGTNVPVYRVKFSDGTEITTTLNHKFAMKDGSISAGS